MMLRPRKAEPRPTLGSFACWVLTSKRAFATCELAGIMLGIGIVLEMYLDSQAFCVPRAEMALSTVVWMLLIGLVSGLIIGWRRDFYKNQSDENPEN